VRLDPAQGEAPVGDHVIKVGHHVGLGHHRKAGQVSDLEPVHRDTGEAAGVEGRVRGSVGEQLTELVALVRAEPRPVPAQPVKMPGQPGRELSGGPLLEPAAGGGCG
jgi:hypothetical protein